MIKNSIISFILIGFMLMVTSCETSDGSDYTFKYDIDGNPRTLDPQTAVDKNSRLIISNIFEGLLKLDQNGNIVSGVAGEYSVSDDGLMYTFQLKNDVYWYNATFFDKESTRCTAADFVFAFQRLLNPATKSQNASQFYSIKNAEKINQGVIKDLKQLGVEAIGDFQLVIRLERPDPQFTNLLTTTPTMPCNEEFYISTKGRYGLHTDSIISNGAFYLSQWNYDRYSTKNNNLILRRNRANNEVRRIYPYGLNFFIDEPDSFKNFLDNSNHSIIVSGEEAMKLIEEGFPYDEFENFIWGIVFNTEKKFSEKDLRLALASSFDRNEFSLSNMGYKKTDVLIPYILKLGDEPYRELAEKDYAINYNTEYSKRLFKQGLAKSQKSNINGLNLIMPDNSVIYEYVSFIIQKWQREFGFYCNIKILNESEYNSKIESGDYDFAVTRVYGEYNSPSAYLNYFNSSGQNVAFYNDPTYSENIFKAETAENFIKSSKFYSAAEKMLIEEAVFIPLCFQTEYFIYQKDCTDITYNPFTGIIDYSQGKFFG